MIDRLERCEALLMQWVASDGCTRVARTSPSDNGSATTTTTTTTTTSGAARAESAELPGSPTTTATTTSTSSPPPCSYANIQKHFKPCPAAHIIKNKISTTTSSMLSDFQLRPGVIRSIEGPDNMQELHSHRPPRSPTMAWFPMLGRGP